MQEAFLLDYQGAFNLASTIRTCFGAKHISKKDRDFEFISFIEMGSSCNYSITASRDPPPYHLNVKPPSSHPALGRQQNPPWKHPKWGSTKSMWQPFGTRVVHCDGCIRKQHVVPARCRGAALYFSHLLTTTSQCEMIHLHWQTAVYPWQDRNPCSKSHTHCYMFMQLDCFIGPIKWSCDNWA